MPIAHTSILVSDLLASKDFYKSALEPLKYSVGYEFPKSAGFGTPGGKLDFWLVSTSGVKVPGLQHTAFAGESEEMVQEFHRAALKAGATCNGPPGLRPMYGPGYYAAFIKDLEGNNMECVYFKPQ